MILQKKHIKKQLNIFIKGFSSSSEVPTTETFVSERFVEIRFDLYLTTNVSEFSDSRTICIAKSIPLYVACDPSRFNTLWFSRITIGELYGLHSTKTNRFLDSIGVHGKSDIVLLSTVKGRSNPSTTQQVNLWPCQALTDFDAFCNIVSRRKIMNYPRLKNRAIEKGCLSVKIANRIDFSKIWKRVKFVGSNKDLNNSFFPVTELANTNRCLLNPNTQLKPINSNVSNISHIINNPTVYCMNPPFFDTARHVFVHEPSQPKNFVLDSDGNKVIFKPREPILFGRTQSILTRFNERLPRGATIPDDIYGIHFLFVQTGLTRSVGDSYFIKIVELFFLWSAQTFATNIGYSHAAKSDATMETETTTQKDFITGDSVFGLNNVTEQKSVIIDGFKLSTEFTRNYNASWTLYVDNKTYFTLDDIAIIRYIYPTLKIDTTQLGRIKIYYGRWVFF